MKTLSFALGAVLIGSALTLTSAKTRDEKADVVAQQLPSYPLTKCPISGETLGADAVDLVVEGHLVRLCCPKCQAAVEKDPKSVIKKIDDAVIAEQKPSYPLTTCPVSGEVLGGDMGAPIDYVYGTRLVRFCCKSCIKDFKKDPAAVMQKIDAALITAQKKTYPLSTCVVSGKPVGDDGVDYLYGTQLVRFCCKDCVAAFQKSPAKFLAKIDAAKG